jgi:hypothetical protein
MSRLFSRLPRRPAGRYTKETTFCEGCGEVCTPECRRDAVLSHYHHAAIAHRSMYL